jgi:putative spermidine/putrescine transport system ATP-binding protein
VFVTHDQEEAMNLSDRIALFDQGRIVQVGSPEELYRRPETLFAARFLGDSNVFELDGGADGGDVGWQGRSWSVAPDTVAGHAGVLTRAAVVVRPEDLAIARSERDVPAGANSVPARVTDLEFMGSYRTAMLALGPQGVTGRARIDASDGTLAIGDDVIAHWRPERQRIVAA